MALARDIDCKPFHRKSIDEVLEETQKLRSNLSFVSGRRRALTEACAHRLLNPDHIGKIDPTVCVWNRLIGSCLCISIDP